MTGPRPRSTAARKAAYQRGLAAEDAAAEVLAKAGFAERDRRVRMKGGEIDLIAEDDETLIFVEVKARASHAAGHDAITARQQKRIRTAIAAWLAVHDPTGRLMVSRAIRCDVVLVAPGADPVHIPNAFPAGGEG